MLANARARRFERRLASADRAGSYARRRSRELQRDFLKERRGVVALVVGTGAVTSLFLIPIRDQAGAWFALGFLWTALVALIWHWAVVFSGSALWVMGDMGEQWTQQTLRKLNRQQWRIAHHVAFKKHEDIDSVVLSTAGVVVVETKWSGEDWGAAKMRDRLLAAVNQANRNRAIVERQVQQAVGPVPTYAVVAVWSPSGFLEHRIIDGVVVREGLELRSWIESLPQKAIPDAQVVGAWEFLLEHIRKRDEADQRKFGRFPRTPTRWLVDLLQLPAGVLAGFMVAGVVLGLAKPPWCIVLLTAISAALLAALRVDQVRQFTRGAVTLIGVVDVMFVVFALYDLVR